MATSVDVLALFNQVTLTITISGVPKNVTVQFKHLDKLKRSVEDPEIAAYISNHQSKMCDSKITAEIVQQYLLDEVSKSGLSWKDYVKDKWGSLVVYVPNRVKSNPRLIDSVFMIGTPKRGDGEFCVVSLSKNSDGNIVIPEEFYCPKIAPSAILTEYGQFWYGEEEEDVVEWDNTLFPVRPSMFVIKKTGYGMYSSSKPVKKEAVFVVEYGEMTYTILLGNRQPEEFMEVIRRDKIVYMTYQSNGILRW